MEATMRGQSELVKKNERLTRVLGWELSRVQRDELRELTLAHSFSVGRGDIRKIDARLYVSHAGLLRLAQRRRCAGIRTTLQKDLCDPAAARWVFKAIVYKSPRSRGFMSHGDADPSNISPNFRGSELRIAETRAVSRALRKAYGIGLCSVEELGWTLKGSEPAPKVAPSSPNGNGNGTHPVPRLRDRLCLLIRQHHLDPALVKAYAADFCGTPSLHLADRDRLENFVATLSERAVHDRDALLCQLNSYSASKEAHS
jgi:hypothetical protein